MGTKPATGAADFGAAQAVADAVLYEGYLLYPYRRSSGKNQVRWQFGVLVPRAWARAHGLVDNSVAGSAESWWQQTECLAEASPTAEVHVRVRFLQLQRRSVQRHLPDGSYRTAGQVEAGSGPELSFDEAVPRESSFRAPAGELLAAPRHFRIEAPGGEDAEPLRDSAGRVMGRVLRRRWPVHGTVTVSLARCETPFRLARLRVRTENTGRASAAAARDQVLRRSLLAAHTLIAVQGGSFVSLLDPPRWAAPAARACANVHTFPVLAGPPGRRDLVLSAPILLYDHPQVAPESPGDLHDATEIDEILCLRTMTLTDGEKREARATDPRAAAIIDRVGGMPPEVLSRLHGAVRSLRPVAGAGPATGTDPAAGTVPAAGTDTDVGSGSVIVGGVTVGRGHRVRLRPRRRGTDPQDEFLAGRTALVESVLLDLDGAHHLAVTLEDDPGADLNRWYGRFRYFSPDEVEPLAGTREPPAGGEPG
jgi:hypothetical protein